MAYEITSEYYDLINSHVDYAAWCDFLEKMFAKYSKEKPSLVLDLGCGTGIITLELARRGYDMTGIDISPEMLDEARTSAAESGLSNDILWLCQDMCDFELYGTVDAVIATCDAVNYLLSPKQIDKCFSLVHNYLIPDGIFVFDISSKAKFKRMYKGDIIIENENVYCGWQNEYNEKTGIAEFYLSYFTPEKTDAGEVYIRRDEYQRQRAWSMRALNMALSRNGFELLTVTDSYSGEPIDGETDKDRIYFVARVKKTEKSGNNGLN